MLKFRISKVLLAITPGVSIVAYFGDDRAAHSENAENGSKFIATSSCTKTWNLSPNLSLVTNDTYTLDALVKALIYKQVTLEGCFVKAGGGEKEKAE